MGLTTITKLSVDGSDSKGPAAMRHDHPLRARARRAALVLGVVATLGLGLLVSFPAEATNGDAEALSVGLVGQPALQRHIAPAQPRLNAAPAGEPGPFKIRSAHNGWCLDSNARGSVYTNPCAGTGQNRYQQWIIWNGGWTKNVATGRCLEKADGSTEIRTRPCADVNSLTTWRHWGTPSVAGWYQSMNGWDCIVTDLGTSHNVSVLGPCGSWKDHLWYVYYDI